jgi:hypothetical protein
MESGAVEIIIVVATILILVWDLYLYIDKYPDNTISQIIIKRTKSRPIIPFLCGLLMGHWFL